MLQDKIEGVVCCVCRRELKMQHFAALVFSIALSFCSVHCFLFEGNEKCKDVSRETRTNAFYSVAVPAIGYCGWVTSLRLFLEDLEVSRLR